MWLSCCCTHSSELCPGFRSILNTITAMSPAIQITRLYGVFIPKPDQVVEIVHAFYLHTSTALSVHPPDSHPIVPIRARRYISRLSHLSPFHFLQLPGCQVIDSTPYVPKDPIPSPYSSVSPLHLRCTSSPIHSQIPNSDQLHVPNRKTQAGFAALFSSAGLESLAAPLTSTRPHVHAPTRPHPIGCQRSR